MSAVSRTYCCFVCTCFISMLCYSLAFNCKYSFMFGRLFVSASHTISDVFRCVITDTRSARRRKKERIKKKVN
ncbi:hypothetical protein J3F84DRAFT_373302 [Trichoderma pleuroticola]